MRTAQHETAERVRVVSGSVNSLGVIKQGVGFVVGKTATGIYTIYWTFPVKQVINLVSTSHQGGGFILPDLDWKPHSILMRGWTDSLVASDISFGFVATVIPR